MFATRRHLPLLTWIALLAICALALLPTVSHALADTDGASRYTEVCTPQGAKLVALDGDAQGGAPVVGADHLQHCPLCSLSCSAPPLPAAAVALVLPLTSTAVPTLFLQAPRTLHAWRSAQPRGPPGTA